MKLFIKYQLVLLIFIFSCKNENNNSVKHENLTPIITNAGETIIFPNEKNINFFETETITSASLTSNIKAPAKVAATVIKSNEGANQNIILFDNPELAGNYTQLIQHLININQIQNINVKQKKTELERVKDLQQHGAATGKDLLEAQTALSMEETNLANERAAIIEHETKLKIGGFQPELLRNSQSGTAYIICDIPENQINKIIEGSKCSIEFTSFPNEKFEGKIDEIADVVDVNTRMLKLRVSINNKNEKLKAGMFATVSFGINEGENISVNKNAIITIQSYNYVFVKTDNKTFQRKYISIGNQVKDRVIVYSGIKNGDNVVIKGVMQLKGLSFGY